MRLTATHDESNRQVQQPAGSTNARRSTLTSRVSRPYAVVEQQRVEPPEHGCRRRSAQRAPAARARESACRPRGRNPTDRVARSRASRSMMPPERNDQTTSHAATAPAIVAASGRLSSRSLRLLEHGAEPDDRRHEGLSEPGCLRQELLPPAAVDALASLADEARVELRRQHAPERDGQRQRDEQRDEERARQQRWRARGTTQAFPERSRGSHGQTKKP